MRRADWVTSRAPGTSPAPRTSGCTRRTLASAGPADDQGVALNRTTIGFAMILIAALVAIAVAATGTRAPDGSSRTAAPVTTGHR